MRIVLLNQQGETVFCGPPRELPLDEKKILEKSLEWFGDPEPCIIHRTYVMNRMHEEILKGLGKTPRKLAEDVAGYLTVEVARGYIG